MNNKNGECAAPSWSLDLDLNLHLDSLDDEGDYSRTAGHPSGFLCVVGALWLLQCFFHFELRDGATL